MNLRNEVGKLLSMGDYEQEDAWGVMVIYGEVKCMGVTAPLEGWYEVEIGGRVCKVESRLRVRRSVLRVAPVAGRKIQVDGRTYRIGRVRDWCGDICWDLELAAE